jgi:hypothetical protein
MRVPMARSEPDVKRAPFPDQRAISVERTKNQQRTSSQERTISSECVPFMIPTLEPVSRLTRDLAEAAKSLSTSEARFLVDAYYTMQAHRIACANQARSLSTSGEPHAVLVWLTDQNETLENQVKRALDKWTEQQELGRWAKSQYGIGPVIAAGLLAHIDFSKCETAGDVWSYAGLAPGQKRKRGEKSNWNPALKRLAFLIGESFVKVSGKPEAFYGQIYLQRKEYEQGNNEAGKYSEQAAAALADKKYSDDTAAKKNYEAGKLPPGHIHMRSKRYAVKLFLAHFFEIGFKLARGKEPPLPYPISHLGHSHVTAPHGY